VYRSILVPIDPERPKASSRALEAARRFARSGGASLSLISIGPKITDRAGRASPGYRRKLGEFLARNGGTGDLREIREVKGSVAAGIRALAGEIGADLIVMSSRDPYLNDCLIGPDAVHVAAFMPCSVLLVR